MHASNTMQVDAMAVSASGRPISGDLVRQLEAPDSWGFSTDGATPPPLRMFVKVLDEKVINAMQVNTTHVQV